MSANVSTTPLSEVPVQELAPGVTTRRPRARPCCTFCNEIGHTIRKCDHTDVHYLFHELVYFIDKYDKDFVCNNLSVLFHPHEAQAILNHRSIKNISVGHERFQTSLIFRRTVVVDVGMPRQFDKVYENLYKKIVCCHPNSLVNVAGSFDVVERVMDTAIRIYELDHNDRVQLDCGTILAGYHNFFTLNRHARFRRYDYEINFQEEVSSRMFMELEEEQSYINETYNPPRIVDQNDTVRYGLARDLRTDDETEELQSFIAPPATTTMTPSQVPVSTVSTLPGEEVDSEPEWLDARPPRNVTVRNNRRIVITSRVRRRENSHESYLQRIYQSMLRNTRNFEDNVKKAHPPVEIEVVPFDDSEKEEEELKDGEKNTVECPICIESVRKIESIYLGCCAYSFCGNCYENQYLTKEHRNHVCMMCRTPFTKIQVFHPLVVELIRSREKVPIDSVLNTELDIESSTALSQLTDEQVVIDDYFLPPEGTPMTLDELI